MCKILDKILPSQNQQFFEKVKHPHQVRFTPGKQEMISIREHLKKKKTSFKHIKTNNQEIILKDVKVLSQASISYF